MFDTLPSTEPIKSDLESKKADFLKETADMLNVCEKEQAEGIEISIETEAKLAEKEEECIGKIQTEEDEEKVKILAKLLARLYARPTNNRNRSITILSLKMKWEQWGLEEKSLIPQDAQDRVTKRANLLFKEIFAHYKLNPEEMMKAWRESIFPKGIKRKDILKKDEQQELVLKNLSALRNLERERPDSASLLAKEFGIMNFARYPRKLLIDQYDRKEDLKNPYGIVIGARRDYNGSSFNNNQVKVWEDLFNQLNGKYRLRVIESGGKYNLARSLIRLDKKYGKKQKISFAILKGHGNSEKFGLGDWSDKSPNANISIEDVMNGEGISRIKEFFTEHATIIIVACLTGKKGGLASKIFEKLGIEVQASDTITGGLKSIKINIEDNKIHFEVIFNKKRFRIRYSGKGKVYK